MREEEQIRCASEAALRRLVFIELPAELSFELGSFKTEPSIPLPLERGPGADQGGFDPSGIRPEALVAGMLRLLAWDPGHRHADYYRAFVTAVRPGIMVELSQAGIAKTQNREWEMAEEIFRALAGLFPDAPEPLLDLAVLFEDRAQVYSQAGKEELAWAMNERALKTYDRLLGFEPPFPAAFFNAAFFFMRRHSFERAVSLLESYERLGDDEDKKNRARALRKDIEKRGCMDALYTQAYDLIRGGEEEAGMAKARQFLEHHPRVWNGWFLVGWAARRLGRWEEGVAAFEKAVELGAEGVESLNELSICLLELGRKDEARRALERALRLEPENVKIIVNLGVVALRRGKPEEARGFFRTALELEPEDESARLWLARV